MTAIQFLLQPGVNFTNRAELKYARAVHLSNELRGRIDEWSASEPVLARVNVLNPHAYEMRAVVRRQPPVDEWSLILGDALHNLRSAFDNLIWGLATLEVAQPLKPQRVAFPVTENEADWDRVEVELASVPEVLRDRLKSLQPWVQGVPRKESLLWLLHHFDIIDKHRGLIDASVRFGQLATLGLELNLEPADTAADAQLIHTFLETPVAIEDDTVLSTISCETHTMHPSEEYLARVHIQFSVIEGDRLLLLDTFLSDLMTRTREWLDIVYAGETYALAMKRSREGKGPNVVSGFVDEAGRPQVLRIDLHRSPNLSDSESPGVIAEPS